MTYTVQQAKDDLTGIAHAGSLQSVRNLYPLMARAARSTISRVDLESTIREQVLPSQVYSDIYDYPLPADFASIISLLPQQSITPADNFQLQASKAFDLQKDMRNDTVSIKNRDGQKTIRINKQVQGSDVKLHEFDSLTTNGTTALVGTATNLSINNTVKVSGAASTQFDIATTGDGIQVTDFDSKDLSQYGAEGRIFVRVYLPQASAITSIQGTIGSDLVSNFLEATITTQQDGTAFQDGWNIIAFQYNSAVVTGVPDITAIDNIRITFTTTSPQQAIRVDVASVSNGELYNIVYYSKYLFVSADGTYKAIPTNDSDRITLDEKEINLWLFECAMLMAQQMQGEDSAMDMNTFREQLHQQGYGLYREYTADHPSQAVKLRQSYYTIR